MFYKTICVIFCATILVSCGGLPSEGKAALDQYFVDSCKRYAECQEAKVINVSNRTLTDVEKANGTMEEWCVKYSRLIKVMDNAAWFDEGQATHLSVRKIATGKWVVSQYCLVE